LFAPNIQNVAVTTDATPDAQRQRLLAAALARKKMAEADTTTGRGRQQQQGFAPRNGGQMAAGLGMVAMGELLNKIATDRETEKAKEGAMAQADAMVTAVQSLGGPFANINANALKGAFLTNPELASQVVKMGMENMLKPQERFETITLPDGRQAQRSTISGKIDVMPEGRGPMAVAPGTSLIDPNTKQPVYTAPAKPEAPTTRTIKQADGSEVAVQWDPQKQVWGPLSAPEGGNAVGVKPTNPYALPGRPTEEQGKAAGFATRMVQGHNIINELEAAAIDGWEAVKARVPGGANFIISEQKQRLEQGKRNYINAILRRESGAVISPEEFANADKQYFPQPGDSPAVIAQKRANREIAIEGVMGSAGPGFKVPEEYKPTRQQEQEAQRQRQQQQQPGNLQPAAPVQGPPMPQEGPMQPPMPQAAPQPAPAPQGLPPLDLIEQEILRRQQQQMQQQPSMPMVP